MPDTNIAVLLIEHRHGLNTYVCADEATAKDQLGKFVDEWWDHEDRLVSEPKPEDLDEKIQAYFDAMDGDESYILSVETMIVGGDKVTVALDYSSGVEYVGLIAVEDDEGFDDDMDTEEREEVAARMAAVAWNAQMRHGTYTIDGHTFTAAACAEWWA